MTLIDLTLRASEIDAVMPGDGVEEGWVIAPAGYAPPLGESVLLRVRAPAAPEGVFLDAVVQWRRAQAVGSQPAGVGLRVMSHSLARWRFLRGLTRPSVAADRRASPRLPTRVAVILVTAPRGSTRIYPCSVTDVSLDGAALAMNHRLEPGEQGRCEWAVGALTFAVQFSVVWSAVGRLGIRLVDPPPSARGAWLQLVEAAASALEGRRLIPSPMRAASNRATVRTTGASAVGGVGSARGTQGAVPDRAAVELAPTSARRRDPRSG